MNEWNGLRRISEQSVKMGQEVYRDFKEIKKEAGIELKEAGKEFLQ